MVLSDLVITLAYYSIPISLIYLVRKRKDIPFDWVFWMFGAFIFLCGTTHLMSVITTWEPAYRLEALVKILTASISIVTAIAVWPLIPRALRIPNLQQLQKMKLELERNEKKFRDLVESAPDALVMINKEGKIVMVNEQTQILFGYEKPELLGKLVEILIPDRFHKAHPEHRNSFFNHPVRRPMGTGLQLYAKRKNGTEFPVEISLSPLETEDGPLVTAAIRDVTDRKKIEQMKNEFISTVSHELRTPLTSIRGSLGLIEGGMGGEISEKSKPLLEMAINNCERLARLINDILDIEKIEAGKIEFKMEELSIQSLIEQAIATNESYARQYKVEFLLEKEGVNFSGVKIKGDTDRLIQVLTNLLSNAAKFSPPNSKTRTSISRNASFIRVSVKDEGPGIPKEFQNRIFQKFAQADSSNTRQKGGTGLGLSISKSIIEKHQGAIGFEPNSPQGTTFYFEIPESVSSKPISIIQENSPKPRILICEDDADVARLLQMMLDQAGYQSDIVYTAKQAEEFLEKRTYDAMTLDIMLPDQDGVSLIHQLRENPKTREIPIIVVSVVAQKTKQEVELKGDSINIIDWIPKPISPQRLLNAIHTALRKHNEPHILYVEDDKDVIQIISKMLEKVAQLTAAYSLQEAKEKIQNETFDLILLDLVLPDGNGIELLPFLKTSSGKPIPVVILSAQDVNTEIKKLVAATLVKSLASIEEIVGTIQTLLK